MKKIKRLTFAILLLTSTIYVGCKKKGCTDKNADNYESDAEKSDGSCAFRYSSAIEVTTPTNGNYDPFDGPDLFVQFAKKSSSTWDYKSGTGSDSYSTSLTTPSVMFTNEEWQYELYDYDVLDPNDLIANGTFNPLTAGSDGKITLTGSGITVNFQYATK
ncbi:MAG: hypothetical protein IPP56_11155 [Bacteroidetes bacterium]|nr:hypothetical protein [Bacteroidota bacterium]MBK9800229.1 hypothetical protein [Bacteroidota bacterium]